MWTDGYGNRPGWCFSFIGLWLDDSPPYFEHFGGFKMCKNKICSCFEEKRKKEKTPLPPPFFLLCVDVQVHSRFFAGCRQG